MAESPKSASMLSKAIDCNKSCEPKRKFSPTALIEQWWSKFDHGLVDPRIYLVLGDSSVENACASLKNDARGPGILSVCCSKYFFETPGIAFAEKAKEESEDAEAVAAITDNKPKERKGPFCDIITFFRPDGMTFAFNIREMGGVPRELRALLIESDMYFVGFQFTKALENVDADFCGKTVNLDLYDILTAIQNFGVLSHIFGNIDIDLISLPTEIFQVEGRVAEDMVEPGSWGTAVRAAIIFDTYALLAKYDSEIVSFVKEYRNSEGIKPFTWELHLTWAEKKFRDVDTNTTSDLSNSSVTPLLASCASSQATAAEQIIGTLSQRMALQAPLQRPPRQYQGPIRGPLFPAPYQQQFAIPGRQPVRDIRTKDVEE